VYVGPRPFREGETLYGRDRENEELTNLLIAERLVLLCAPSGAGKTSLTQAKLIPAMRGEGFLVPTKADEAAPTPLVIRPGVDPGAAPAANRYALATLLRLEEGWPKEEQLEPAALAVMDLDAYLQQRYPTASVDRSGGSTFRPLLLVFDQFEEVLTADPTDEKAKREFFRQLGQALRDRNRWALFAIREDHVAGLDPYLPLLPNRLSATYRLDFLRISDEEERGAQEVLAAIREPAEAALVRFPVEVARAVVDDLREVHLQQVDGDFVTQKGSYVEPVHLQVVCRDLWEHRADPSAITEVDLRRLREADAEGESGVDAALARYYAERVKRAAEEGRTSEGQLRAWLGRQLISPRGLRRSLLSGDEQTQGVTPVALKALQDAYLVRAEARRGAIYYELAHDRLIQPVRRNNAAWDKEHANPLQERAKLWDQERARQGGRAEELLLTGRALAEFERWAAQNPGALEGPERDFLEACRAADARRRHRLAGILTGLLVAAGAALVALVVLTVWAFHERGQAETDRLRAKEAEAAARKDRDLAQVGEFTVQTQLDLHADPRGAAKHAIELLKERVKALQDPVIRARKAQVGEAILRDAVSRLARPDRLLPAQVGPARVIAFSPDGDFLVTGGYDGSLRTWPVTAEGFGAADVVQEFAGPVTVLACGGSGDRTTLLLAGTEAGEVGLFRREEGKGGGTVQFLGGRPAGPRTAALQGTRHGGSLQLDGVGRGWLRRRHVPALGLAAE
jgi:hypothetical protein